MAQLILEKADTQHLFCVKRKKKKKKTGAVEVDADDGPPVEMKSDCEVLINAKERPQVMYVCMYYMYVCMYVLCMYVYV